MGSITTPTTLQCRPKNKIIVIMGATGSGKSRLSIDIATRFPSEIINSDKIQFYKGLDITSNKIPLHDQCGVPHHLLGEYESANGELSPADFRSIGASLIADIASRNRVPIIVGGSTSFIHALVSEQFQPDSDVFDGFNSPSAELRYECCFLWVDVTEDVLFEYLSKRVDQMLDTGMLHELKKYYDSSTESDLVSPVGITKSIGVQEFHKYFRCCQLPGGRDCNGAKRELLEEAVTAIKENTYLLAKKQVNRIQILRSAGWNLQRLDGTEAFQAVLASDSDKFSAIWDKEMVGLSVKIVKTFLEE